MNLIESRYNITISFFNGIHDKVAYAANELSDEISHKIEPFIPRCSISLDMLLKIDPMHEF
jgi:hypothetical protein